MYLRKYIYFLYKLHTKCVERPIISQVEIRQLAVLHSCMPSVRTNVCSHPLHSQCLIRVHLRYTRMCTRTYLTRSASFVCAFGTHECVLSHNRPTGPTHLHQTSLEDGSGLWGALLVAYIMLQLWYLGSSVTSWPNQFGGVKVFASSIVENSTSARIRGAWSPSKTSNSIEYFS